MEGQEFTIAMQYKTPVSTRVEMVYLLLKKQLTIRKGVVFMNALVDLKSTCEDFAVEFEVLPSVDFTKKYG